MCAEKHVVSGNGIRITHEDRRIAISQGGVRIRHEEKPVRAGSALTGFVYLLVDCSGSMSGGKINQAKRGALSFAKDALAKGYQTGLIKFESSATHICEPQSEISMLERRLKEISLGGSTDMTGALLLATQQLLDRRGFRVIVIVTDGMPDNQSTALEAARQAKKNGIDIITRGTDDADRDFLKRLASRSELGVKVSREEFETSIASAAESLPLLEGGRPKTGRKGR
jgi:Mg-chelatase subunit ChlD